MKCFSHARVSIFAFLTTFLIACAATPSSITPAAVSVAPYAEMSCDDLMIQLANERDGLGVLSAEQISTRGWDIFLNILIFPGLGAATPDHEDDIATAKGRIVVIQDEYQERCGG